MREPREAPQEEPRREHEHEREGHLGHDQRPAEGTRAFSRDGSALLPDRVLRGEARSPAARGPRRRAAPSRASRATVNSSTRQWSDTSSDTSPCWAVVIWRTSRRLPHCATSRPSAAPGSASSRHSASSWRARRWRDAPSASRAPSSWRRALARASSRLARFAHAISSTSTTTPITVEQRPLVAAADLGEAVARRHERERPLAAGTSRGPWAPVRRAGWPRGSAGAPPAAPGRRVHRLAGPQAADHVEPPRGAVVEPAPVVPLHSVHHPDRHRDVERPADARAEERRAASRPTTVNGMPLSVSARPIASAAPP